MYHVEKLRAQGLWLPSAGLAFDGYHPRATDIIVTHAHADHVPRHTGRARVWSSPATAALMRQRGFHGRVTPVAFETPFRCCGEDVTLYPAGHILGSAMVHVAGAAGTLLYTGDCRTPPSPASEGFVSPEAVDTLVVEATFGLPLYRWATHAKLFEQIQTFASETLQAGGTPAFLAYNLGKAQEVLQALAPLGETVQVHGAAYPLCTVYEQFGVDLGRYAPYDRPTASGTILVMPSSAYSGGMGSHTTGLRAAYVSGWAALEARRTQLTVDALIPLSDHLDFFELVSWCRWLAPRHVYVTHTPNPDVVLHYLARHEIQASHLAIERTEEEE